MGLFFIIMTLMFFTSCSSTAESFGHKTENFEKVKLNISRLDSKILEMKTSFNGTPKDINSKTWVSLKISHMVEIDQYMRKSINSSYTNAYNLKEKENFQKQVWTRVSNIDKENTAELKKLLVVYEWFIISEFNKKTDKDAWLLVQHADLDLKFQKKILVILKNLYPKEETNKSNYAYLYDRVRAIGEKKPQRYGTQGKCVGPGEWEPSIIEDPSSVDERRIKLGLVTMSEYKTWFKEICKESQL